jgi:hypothetical protein
MSIAVQPATRPVIALAAVVFGAGGLLAGCSDGDGGSAGTTTETVAENGAEETAEETVEAQEFVTRPDLSPPLIDVEAAGATAPGLVFLAPKQADAQRGPLIVDDAGEIVWSQPIEDAAAADFRVQTYRGEPVLTWYEGTSEDGYGRGEFVIADASYREIARVAAGNGLSGDLHEFQLTAAGTALVLAYEPGVADLTAVGGPAAGHVLDNVVQEIDVATGQVLFEWNAGDHVPVTDTYRELVPDAAATDDERDEDGSEDAPLDWFHVNSVAEDGDALLVSARNTHAVYAIDRATGAVRWTLGGRSSDYAMGDGTTFAWQHDARRLADGTISLFDNQAAPPIGDESRGLVLALDDAAAAATLVRELVHPDGVLAGSQGNTQVLADGSVVVGWGSEGRVTEFDPDGAVVFDATWAPADSYRVYRMPWTGRPATVPDVVARQPGDGDSEAIEVHVSWNGATEVAEWRIVEAGVTAAKDGFETRIELDAADAADAGLGVGDTVTVEALDATGAVIGTSTPVTVNAPPDRSGG